METKPEKYKNINMCPPPEIAEVCRQGIELGKQYGRGSTIVGIKLAQSIISASESQTELSVSKIKQIYNFFCRHKRNSKNKTKNDEPGNGKIAWAMWGGDKCCQWVKNIIREMNKIDKTGAKNMLDSLVKLADILDSKQLRAEANYVDGLIKKTTQFDLVVALDHLLADEFVLYTKLRNYHWNILGPQFNDLHKFFEDQYVIIEDVVDTVAERIRAIGAKAPGTLSEFSRISAIKEYPGAVFSEKEMLKDLLDDYSLIIKTLRDNITKTEPIDPVTSHLLADICFKHEKTKWMLESLLTQLKEKAYPAPQTSQNETGVHTNT
jgi:starvation-inducible DNA-binding protein